MKYHIFLNYEKNILGMFEIRTDEELKELYGSSSIMRIIKRNRVRQVGHLYGKRK